MIIFFLKKLKNWVLLQKRTYFVLQGKSAAFFMVFVIAVFGSQLLAACDVDQTSGKGASIFIPTSSTNTSGTQSTASAPGALDTSSEISVVSMTTTIGSATSAGGSAEWNADSAISDLTALPVKYSIEQAVKDGCFVIIHGKLMSDPQIAEGFEQKTKVGTMARLRIAQSTIEGDLIIMQVDFADGVYHVITDSSRDHFRGTSPAYHTYSFPYLKTFTSDHDQIAYLVTDHTLTFERIQLLMQRSSISSEYDIFHLYQYREE